MLTSSFCNYDHPFFKAMFQNDMIETNDGEVIINEVPIEVLKLLVRYMYCGKLNDSEIRKYCLDLYDAAVMYQLDSLKTICEKVLCSEAEKPGLARLMLTVSELYNFPKLGKIASKAARKRFIANVSTLNAEVSVEFDNFFDRCSKGSNISAEMGHYLLGLDKPSTSANNSTAGPGPAHKSKRSRRYA